jgi:uncharacterized NAD(P)/FAD-binding protein YdhS
MELLMGLPAPNISLPTPNILLGMPDSKFNAWYPNQEEAYNRVKEWLESRKKFFPLLSGLFSNYFCGQKIKSLSQKAEYIFPPENGNVP